MRANGDYVAAEMSVSTAIIGEKKERYYMAFLKGVTEESHRAKIFSLQENVFKKLSGDDSEQDIADMLCAEVEQLVPNSAATLLQVNPERNLEILSGEGLSRRKIAMLLRITLTDADIAAMAARPEEARSVVWKGRGLGEQESEFPDCWASAIYNGTGELIGIFALYSRNRDKITNWPQKIIAGCIPSCAAVIERGKTRQQLNRLDRYDPLTGLLNRSATTAIMQDMTVSRTAFALLFLDVDLFQDINNFMGYDKGDKVLRVIADRLSALCRSNFTTSRLGGDDFLVIIPGSNHDMAHGFADSLMAAMREPIMLNDQELIISLSVGISLYPEDGTEVEVILNRAEMAMHEAKKNAQKSFRFLGDLANDDAKSRVIIGSALRKAIQNTELKLFYQPQLSHRTGEIYGVEALSRWTHATLGSISPALFIPIAEESAQIEAIGLWSLEEACHQLVAWDQAGLYVPVVSVNLSMLHFRNPALPEQISVLLDRYGLAAKRLTIEITEGVMMAQAEDSIRTLRKLHDIGVGLAIDDFGTGFSSLSRISSLSLTELKIDRSFIINVETEISSLIVTEAAINIGNRLGLSVVAEGVEDQAQAARLLAMGCDVMQGYLFARPMPPEEIIPWVQAQDMTGKIA